MAACLRAVVRALDPVSLFGAACPARPTSGGMAACCGSRGRRRVVSLPGQKGKRGCIPVPSGRRLRFEGRGCIGEGGGRPPNRRRGPQTSSATRPSWLGIIVQQLAIIVQQLACEVVERTAEVVEKRRPLVVIVSAPSVVSIWFSDPAEYTNLMPQRRSTVRSPPRVLWKKTVRTFYKLSFC